MAHSLPLSALVAMTANAYGSTRGFDELVFEPAKVVNEYRLYKSYTSVCSFSRHA